MSTWVLSAIWLQWNVLAEVGHNLRLIATQDDLLPLTLIVLGTALVLAVLARRQRVHIRVALVMFVTALVLIFLSGVPPVLGWSSARTRFMPQDSCWSASPR